MATDENITHPENRESPPKALVKKNFEKDGYTFLKTVHSLEELDIFRYQQECQFKNVKAKPGFNRVTLHCHKRSAKIGKCLFVLLVQRRAAATENGNGEEDEFDIYAHSEHNHPLKKNLELEAEHADGSKKEAYIFLKTIHSIEELNACRAQNYCKLNITKRSLNFMRITLHCNNRRISKGNCPFVLVAERTAKGSDEIRVYAHSKHNHPINKRKSKVECKKKRKTNLHPDLEKKKKKAVKKNPQKQREEEVEESQMEEEEEDREEMMEQQEEEEKSEELQMEVEKEQEEETAENDAGPPASSENIEQTEQQKQWSVERIQRQLSRALEEERIDRVAKWMVRTGPDRIDEVLAGLDIEEMVIFLKMGRKDLRDASDKESVSIWFDWIEAALSSHGSELAKVPNLVDGVLSRVLKRIERRELLSKRRLRTFRKQLAAMREHMQQDLMDDADS